MTFYANNAYYDAALLYLKTNMDGIYVCDTSPTTHAQATASYKLAGVAHTIAGSPANGDVSGRKIEVTTKASISITGSCSAAHVALVDDGSSALLYVAECSSQALTASGTVTVPAFDIEILLAT